MSLGTLPADELFPHDESLPHDESIPHDESLPHDESIPHDESLPHDELQPQDVPINDDKPLPQTTSCVVMVKPAFFRHNFQTAIDNAYQKKPENMTEEEVTDLATLSRAEAFAKHPKLKEKTDALDQKTNKLGDQEFDNMVEELRKQLLEVIVIQDVLEHDTPDSIFPNNPNSLHMEGGGTAVKHAMRNSNRRPEKDLPITEVLTKQFGFRVKQVIDLSDLEDSEHFVEGTGSMVLDRTNKIAYASLSQRTTREGVNTFAAKMGLTPVIFRSFDRLHKKKDEHGNDTDEGSDVYHTNVVMSVGNNFAVICSEAITDDKEREMVLQSLRNTGKEIIEITTEQMNGFAGNILEVQNKNGEPMIVMSQTAHETFSAEQLKKLGKYGKIVAASIPTIEEHGGGSARCMMLEVHLPRVEDKGNL